MELPPEAPRVLVGLLLALGISYRGRRKRSLSPSGALAAFAVGFLSYASGTRFGLTMYVFYLAGTRATKYKAELKKRIEDGYQASGGNRGAGQVLASSLPGVVIAVSYFMKYRHDDIITTSNPTRSAFLLAYLLFYAACAGDTFASEIGIAMPGPGKEPVLILAPWRRVPRGTNGGITWEGTVASGLGGLIVGMAYLLCSPRYTLSQLCLLVVGVAGGVIGSTIDSIIGAVAQTSWLHIPTGRVLQEKPTKSDDVRHICGVDLLSGEAVNALSAVLTAATAPFFISLFQAGGVQ